jgi:hypothetical protein
VTIDDPLHDEREEARGLHQFAGEPTPGLAEWRPGPDAAAIHAAGWRPPPGGASRPQRADETFERWRAALARMAADHAEAVADWADEMRALGFSSPQHPRVHPETRRPL